MTRSGQPSFHATLPRLTCAIAFILVALSPCHSIADQGDCSQPATTGPKPVASDCLFILRAAVGSEVCSPACICAPKGSLPATASDALLCLRSVVRLPATLDCPCGPTTTTPTTSTSSTLPPTTTTTTTTTVTTTTTSTTLLDCTVRFRLTSTDTVGGLTYEANTQLIFGLFVGNADAVDCTPLTSEGLFSFNNDQASKILTTGYTNEIGLVGPADLADCTYATNDAGLAPGDFRMTVTDAIDPASETIEPTVEVSSVDCGG